MSLAKALLAFQADAPPVHLDATNPHFRSKYASLGGVVAAIRPTLNKHGIAYTQPPTNIDGQPALRTILMHAESGETLEETTPLVLPKQDPQGYGSALTYTRRYALLSILGLVGDDDDDANAATPQPAAKPAAKPAAQPQPTGGGSPADVVLHFSKHKGKRLGDLTPAQIRWYAETWEPNPQYKSEADEALKNAAIAMLLT